MSDISFKMLVLLPLQSVCYFQPVLCRTSQLQDGHTLLLLVHNDNIRFQSGHNNIRWKGSSSRCLVPGYVHIAGVLLTVQTGGNVIEYTIMSEGKTTLIQG